MEQEPRLRGFKFDAGEFLLTANDRRLAPGSAAMASLRDELKSVVRHLYGADRIDVDTAVHAPHERIRMLVRAASRLGVASGKFPLSTPLIVTRPRPHVVTYNGSPQTRPASTF